MFVFVCAWVCYVFVCFVWHLSCDVVWCVCLWGVVFVVSVVHVDVFVCCVWFIAWCCMICVLCVLLCVLASVSMCLCAVSDLLCDVV